MDRNIIGTDVIELIVDVTDMKDIILFINELPKASKNTDYKYLITTDLPITEFHKHLGEGVAKTTKFEMEIPEEVKMESDGVMYEIMGRMALDTMLTRTYFIKSVADEMVYEIREVN